MVEPMDDPTRMRPLAPPGLVTTPDPHGRAFYPRKPGEPRELYVEQDAAGEWGVVELKWFRDRQGEKDFTTFWIDARRFQTQDGAETYIEVVQESDETTLAKEREPVPPPDKTKKRKK